MPPIKSSEYLCEFATGENIVGSKQRERERERKSAMDQQTEKDCWTEMDMAWVRNGRR